jgi:hypothetical protein
VHLKRVRCPIASRRQQRSQKQCRSHEEPIAHGAACVTVYGFTT